MGLGMPLRWWITGSSLKCGQQGPHSILTLLKFRGKKLGWGEIGCYPLSSTQVTPNFPGGP